MGTPGEFPSLDDTAESPANSLQIRESLQQFPFRVIAPLLQREMLLGAGAVDSGSECPEGVGGALEEKIAHAEASSKGIHGQGMKNEVWDAEGGSKEYCRRRESDSQSIRAKRNRLSSGTNNLQTVDEGDYIDPSQHETFHSDIGEQKRQNFQKRRCQRSVSAPDKLSIPDVIPDKEDVSIFPLKSPDVVPFDDTFLSQPVTKKEKDQKIYEPGWERARQLEELTRKRKIEGTVSDGQSSTKPHLRRSVSFSFGEGTDEDNEQQHREPLTFEEETESSTVSSFGKEARENYRKKSSGYGTGESEQGSKRGSMAGDSEASSKRNSFQSQISDSVLTEEDNQDEETETCRASTERKDSNYSSLESEAVEGETPLQGHSGFSSSRSSTGTVEEAPQGLMRGSEEGNVPLLSIFDNRTLCERENNTFNDPQGTHDQVPGNPEYLEKPKTNLEPRYEHGNLPCLSYLQTRSGDSVQLDPGCLSFLEESLSAGARETNPETLFQRTGSRGEPLSDQENSSLAHGIDKSNLRGPSDSSDETSPSEIRAVNILKETMERGAVKKDPEALVRVPLQKDISSPRVREVELALKQNVFEALCHYVDTNTLLQCAEQLFTADRSPSPREHVQASRPGFEASFLQFNANAVGKPSAQSNQQKRLPSTADQKPALPFLSVFLETPEGRPFSSSSTSAMPVQPQDSCFFPTLLPVPEEKVDIALDLCHRLERAARCVRRSCTDKCCVQVKAMLANFQQNIQSDAHLNDTGHRILLALRLHSERCDDMKCPMLGCTFLLKIDPWDAYEALNHVRTELTAPFMQLTSSQQEPGHFLEIGDGAVQRYSGPLREGEDWIVLCNLSESKNVVMAQEIGIDRRVVIKKTPLHEDQSQWTVYEKLRSLQHPHVVTHYWAMEQGEWLLICTQFHPGGTLKEILEHAGKLTAERAFFYLRQVLQGVLALHGLNILYLYWTSCNLLLDHTKQHVKIANLSSCTTVTSKDQQTSHVDYGDLKHSLPAAVVPPEMLTSQPLSKQSDSWGCGCLLYELLSGAPVWDQHCHCAREEIWHQMQRNRYVDHKAMLQFPVQRRLFNICWQIDPSRRQSLEVILSLLK